MQFVGQKLQQVSLSTGLIFLACQETIRHSNYKDLFVLYDKQFWFFVWPLLDIQIEIWIVSFILIFIWILSSNINPLKIQNIKTFFFWIDFNFFFMLAYF